MIVVGVDGSQHSIEALAWALDEARLRGTNVLALHAWTLPAPPPAIGFYTPELHDPAPFQEGAERQLEQAVSAVDTEGVTLEHRAVQGTPADVLIRAAEDAELLVVGSRGHGGFASLVLGSVSQQCVQHASCPVVVVPPAQG